NLLRRQNLHLAAFDPGRIHEIGWISIDQFLSHCALQGLLEQVICVMTRPAPKAAFLHRGAKLLYVLGPDLAQLEVPERRIYIEPQSVPVLLPRTIRQALLGFHPGLQEALQRLGRRGSERAGSFFVEELRQFLPSLGVRPTYGLGRVGALAADAATIEPHLED